MHNKFAVIPFAQRRIRDRYLVSNIAGGWDFLDAQEFRELSSFSLREQSPLFRRLHERGLLVDERNIKQLVADYRQLNSNLFYDASLHIAVVTTRCNLRCGYCQAKSTNERDMSIDVARHVLKCLFGVKNPRVTLEFQGGEPLLNWETVSFLIERARSLNKDKDLIVALVSNLTLLDETKMEFLKRFNVGVCASLDGPRDIHDRNRAFATGAGSYDLLLKKVEIFKNKFGGTVQFLPTITRYSFDRYRDIIDEYVGRGQTEIALRPLSRLGSACVSWSDIGYSAEEFIEFYRNAMDYILALNKKGVFIRERMAAVMLEKILNRRDPGYTELMNPCGAGRSQIVYMPEGNCYPCDEARMVDEEMFLLGNITNANLEVLLKNDNLLHLLESSLMNLWDPSSVFAPWMGTCPVVNYALQKNFVPKIWCLPLHKIYNFQFSYIFEKILEDQENLNIFKSWIFKKGG